MREIIQILPATFSSITAVLFSTSLGACQHKSPLFQPLERCLVSWSLEKRSAVVAVRFRSDSLLRVDGAWMLRIPAVLQGFIPCPRSRF